MLSGWGRVEEGGDWSRTLKRARMPIVSDQECTRNVRLTQLLSRSWFLFQLFQFHNSLEDLPYFPFKINRKQLCAGKTTPTKKGGCQGDSGGPLVTQDSGNHGWSVVGVTSWGLGPAVEGGGCGNDRYTVFTEVGQYLPWIAENFNLKPPLVFQS